VDCDVDVGYEEGAGYGTTPHLQDPENSSAGASPALRNLFSM
jgi:hypothetical protein